jgi:hypothetical protein
MNPRRSAAKLLTKDVATSGPSAATRLPRYREAYLADAIGSKRSRSRNVLKVPWHKTPLKRRREILVPESARPQDARAMRSENRALLIASMARGRRWLNELIAEPTANTTSIATRDGNFFR